MADGSRSSSLPGTQENALLRWLVPSVADLIFVALLATLLFASLSMKLLGDAGIGWHIRSGQLIMATHTIPRVDPFSSQIDRPWIAWEWLYDVIVGWLESHAGLNGVVWLTAVIIAAVFAATYRLLVRRGTGLLIAFVLTLLAIGASMIHFLARPHVLSWLFALIWFWILSAYELTSHTRANRRIWLLPLLMLIWVNVHGGFLLGFVLLAIFWLGSFWSWVQLREVRIEESLQKIVAGKRVRELTAVGLLSAAVSLVNPYGWHLHEHIYGYLTNRFFMDHIDEFQSPNFHGIAQRCFLILLLISIAALVANRRKLGATQVLIVLFAVYAGLYASRNIPVSSILLALIIGPIIPSSAFSRFTERMGSVDSRMRRHLWSIVATVAAFVIALNGGRAGSSQLMYAQFDPQRMPVAAVDFLQGLAARDYVPGCGRPRIILGPDYWGGYFIYRLYPRTKVAIDDRHDFYGEYLLLRYLKTMRVEPGWNDLVGLQSCLLLPRKAALSEILQKMPEWKALYSDDVATVITRTQIPPDSDKRKGD